LGLGIKQYFPFKNPQSYFEQSKMQVLDSAEVHGSLEELNMLKNQAEAFRLRAENLQQQLQVRTGKFETLFMTIISFICGTSLSKSC
jgi:hypothetical protein